MKLIDGKLTCDCKLSVYTGVPCQHEAAVSVHIGKPECLVFADRWRIKYFDPEERIEILQLPFVTEDDVEELLLKKLESVKGVQNPERKERKRRKGGPPINNKKNQKKPKN